MPAFRPDQRPQFSAKHTARTLSDQACECEHLYGGGRAAGRGGGRATYDSAREVDNEDLEEPRPPRLFHEQRPNSADNQDWETKGNFALAGGRPMVNLM